MTTYAIGDLQGCLDPLKKLLDKINFAPGTDTLWFVGDLVNRGPQSLETLQFVKGLGKDAISVLGNHDMHLLGVVAGVRQTGGRDTIDPILKSDDLEPLCNWLRHLPLLHHDDDLNVTMVHAGIHPRWSLSLAKELACEVETVLRSDDFAERLPRLIGNKPATWSKKLGKRRRRRFALNVFTRMRFCTHNAEMDFSETCPPAKAHKSLLPWYAVPDRVKIDSTIVFGHWSSHPPLAVSNVIPLDHGCVWGGSLSALALETGVMTSVSCA